jgi:hypothetical protein
MVPRELSPVGDGIAPTSCQTPKSALRRQWPALPSDAVRSKTLDPVLLLLVAGALVAVAVLAWPSGGEALSPGRASWSLTPGVVNPDVTQSSIAETICRRGWTRTIRPPVDYTNELKLEQMKTYRRTGSPSDYQEDHLISLELGGHPTDPRNLWPEPEPQALEVDQIENELNDAICAGQITLAEGQRRISVLKHTEG